MTLPAVDLDRARDWYAKILDLQPVIVGDGSLRYDTGGVTFTVYSSTYAGKNKATAGAWSVNDFDSAVGWLGERGVPLRSYNFEGLETKDGVLTFSDGTRVVWFKDSEDNILGLVERESYARVSDKLADLEVRELPQHRPPGGSPIRDDSAAAGTVFRSSPLGVTLPAADLRKARDWYATMLDLQPVTVGNGSLEYNVGGVTFTVYKSMFAGKNGATAGSWSVNDFDGAVKWLAKRGVPLEEYDFEGLETKDGVLTFSDGQRVAWFKDSEHNILGLVTA